MDNSKSKIDFFNSKLENKIIFSSKIFPIIDQKINENFIIFNKIHKYRTAFYKESKISDFCIHKDLYFPDSYNDIYCKINRFYAKNFRAHHMNNGTESKIDFHFGPSGGGKSICSRAIIHNYMHFEIVSGREPFYPTIFFNLRIINSLVNEKDSLFNILIFETMGLFRHFNDWEKYMEKLKVVVYNNYYPFDIIFQINDNISNDDAIKKILIVIDHYSEKFDVNNINLEKITKFCIDKKNKNFILLLFLI